MTAIQVGRRPNPEGEERFEFTMRMRDQAGESASACQCLLLTYLEGRQQLGGQHILRPDPVQWGSEWVACDALSRLWSGQCPHLPAFPCNWRDH